VVGDVDVIDPAHLLLIKRALVNVDKRQRNP